MSSITKLKCDNTECGKEIEVKLGAKAVAVCAVMGNEPKDFCSTRCAIRYLKALDMDKESKIIIEKAEEKKAIDKAIAEVGKDKGKIEIVK